MILTPNLITASVISQTKPELYVTNLPTRNYIENGVTFNSALTAVEIRTLTLKVNTSEIGVVYGTSLTGATLKPIKQNVEAVETGAEFSALVTGATLYAIKHEVFEKELDAVEFNNTLISAELNSDLNRGYSTEDSVIYGVGLVKATLTQRNV